MSRIALYWRATRPFAFSASVVSALLGGLVAVLHAGVRLNLGHYVLVAVGAACAHAAANLLNDFYDYRKGVDRPGTLGSSGVIIEGLMMPRAVLIESLIFWLVSAAIAVYFIITTGLVLLPLIIGGLVLGVGYTAAPTTFKYRGLGDLAVFVAFGIGITIGSYAVQTRELSWIPAAYGLPISFLVAGILHGNNLRDSESDRVAGITTFAMSLGPRRGWQVHLALVGLAYASLIAFVIAGIIVPWGLVTLASAPLAIQLLRAFGGVQRTAAPGAPIVALAQLDVATARLHMIFGLLLTAGVLVALLS